MRVQGLAGFGKQAGVRGHTKEGMEKGSVRLNLKGVYMKEHWTVKFVNERSLPWAA